MNKTTTTTSGGCGILVVLQIIFIVLKCLGLISWSWPIVLIPLWIDLTIVFLVVIVCVIILVVCDKKH